MDHSGDTNVDILEHCYFLCETVQACAGAVRERLPNKMVSAGPDFDDYVSASVKYVRVRLEQASEEMHNIQTMVCDL